MTGAVAVVGLDCAFATATGVDAYWDLLMRGGDAIGPLPRRRWQGPGFDGRVQGGFLADPDVFDHAFFSVPPREAAAMDPQQRLLLQSAWRALEDSGRAPGTLAGSDTGVFVGTMSSEWAQLHMGNYARVSPQLGSGSATGMAANRISYHLDLKGPSLAVDTACSSSLVAVHLAVASLLSGECDTVLAAGANLVLTPALGLVYRQMGLAAPDGRCKPFSADADGIVRSDGVGVVVLRRLADALADKQRVYAVIKGTAVNQDGRSNGVTAPSRWSQREVIAAAYRRAGVTPDQVRFIEAHGTGTVLGDIIECAALGEVHAVPREQPCAIGSVKGNLGHTEGAAGIAGLIKVALALHHRIVPASRFATRENPRLKLAERGLRLLKSPLRLEAGPSVAAVSSFGMGGTNAHAVLASAPRVRRAPVRRGGAASGGVFTVSADTPGGLRRNLLTHADAVARRPRGDAAALCWSSNRVKTGLTYRAAFTVRDTGELAAALRTAAADERLAEGVADRAWRPPVIGFLFTGQGVQEPGMSAGLYGTSPLYRSHLDAVDAALSGELGISIKELILSGSTDVHRTLWAQPALFAVQYALAGTLGELGVAPDVVIGHSLGEIAAATVAGALSLTDAARLVAARGRCMDELPAGGGMLAVGAAASELAALLTDAPGVVVAAVNGPADTVVSGPRDALDALARRLAGQGVRARHLHVSHAFHSPLMAPALDRFTDAAARLTYRAPEVPVASTRYGRLLADEPMDAAYFRDQAVEPVLFADAFAAMIADLAPTALVEIGPRPQLLTLAARAELPDGVPLIHPAPGTAATVRDLAEALAVLYRSGLEPRWDGLYPPEQRRHERLVPYQFSTDSRFWRSPAQPSTAPHEQDAPPAADATAAREDPASGTQAAEGSAGSGDTARSPVLDAVIEAVVEVGKYPPEQVTAVTRFYEDLGFDSVMIMQLKDRIENRLPQADGITVPQLLPELRSVGTLAAFLGEWISVGAAT
ncbi:type I polyketide synthase [Streptomyces beihaiensis]|uniref:Beta-ketoacyl synthase N-terminal-like domain-containing protein n=1 Tax=Streptomyces beihaiensis TaxID=2984495 RepID=A0ABT3TWF6_9ACTN|nr:beta-ketoacyl synthase N-terminal-like domain-containing protein [Streptomyces beihaiensis]MCX3061384.1 beta-ketoacyl synthase N-terminal-like domain-containing protein [Streptomyces beihaiensis]